MDGLDVGALLIHDLFGRGFVFSRAFIEDIIAPSCQALTSDFSKSSLIRFDEFPHAKLSHDGLDCCAWHRRRERAIITSEYVIRVSRAFSPRTSASRGMLILLRRDERTVFAAWEKDNIAPKTLRDGLKVTTSEGAFNPGRDQALTLVTLQSL